MPPPPCGGGVRSGGLQISLPTVALPPVPPLLPHYPVLPGSAFVLPTSPADPAVLSPVSSAAALPSLSPLAEFSSASSGFARYSYPVPILCVPIGGSSTSILCSLPVLTWCVCMCNICFIELISVLHYSRLRLSPTSWPFRYPSYTPTPTSPLIYDYRWP